MRKIVFLFIPLFLLSVGIGTSNEQFTLYIENVEIAGIKQIGTADIILSEAPNGLSGYNLTISLYDSKIAIIKEVIFPPWATLYINSSLPSDSIWIKAVDLNNEIKEGATNIVLATIIFESKAEGNTCVNLTITKIDDDEGYPIDVIVENASLAVFINHLPSKPSSPCPTDGATNVAITTTLSWQCSDVDSDSLTYDVYFGTSSNPPKITNNLTTNSYSSRILQYSTTYYWKVVAWDEHGAKNESEIWHFTTEAYTPPPSPPNHPPSLVITYPSVEANVSGVITIHGKASDEDGNETLQKVEVKIDNGGWIVATGTTSWEYEWNTTQVGNGNHTIYARAYDGKGYSSIVSINVNVFNNHKPFIEIIEPENRSIVNGSIIIKGKAWDEDGNETLQKVEVRIDDGEWKNVTGILNWTYTIDTKELENGKHTIYARAYDGDGYSNVVSFKLKLKIKKAMAFQDLKLYYCFLL
ncbi:MAG TPA: hypothetical protein ENI33_02045 [Thermoplasmatales archaeon]|nr:hypothetical protein [Thermoplasmatales archaeon]